MGNKLKCDVGIVSYNSQEELTIALQGLSQFESQSINKIIIVENGNRPHHTEKCIGDFKFKTQLIHKGKNIGFARACNLIISHSTAPYLCLLNPDTIIKKPFLEKAIYWLENKRNVGILGPKIIDANGDVQGSARGFPTLMTAFFGRTSFLTKLFPKSHFARQNLKIDTDHPIETDWVSGACMIVKSRAIKEVGPMDEGFFMYWEDCDWCRQFWEKGWRVYYHPGIGPLIHLTGTSSRKTKLKCHFWFHLSAVRLYVKYDKSPCKIASTICLAGAFFRFCLLLPFVFIK